MKRGNILLQSGRDAISRMIQIITGSKWSHSAWFWDSNIILEASYQGVRLAPFEIYKNSDIMIVRPMVDDDTIEKALRYALTLWGKKYDYRLFLGLYLRYLFRIGRRKGVRDWKSGYICSELVAKPLWRVAGFRFRDDVAVENIVPGDIAESPRVVKIFNGG